jgi:hypothetical protein
MVYLLMAEKIRFVQLHVRRARGAARVANVLIA